FPEAVEELARDAGLEVPRAPASGDAAKRADALDLSGVLLHAAKHYRAQLREAPRAVEYLKSRGLTGNVAARFGIGYAPDDWQARPAVRASRCVVVVEGYMDVVALAQHGVEYAVATLGTATTPAHAQKLFRLTDTVVFCFDADEAGRRAAWRALENTLPVIAD